MKTRESLEYIIPEDMKMYLSHYGRHFNRKMYEFAVSCMRKDNDEKVTPISKEEFNNKMSRYGVSLKNNVLYDGCYVWSMCEADYLHSSVPGEDYQAVFVKDTIDDPDAVDGQVFNRFYSDMCLKGIPIDWEEML